jgi:hypothetical protein
VLLPSFSPPGNLAELSDQGAANWSEEVSTEIDQAALGPTDDQRDSPRAQFFNPTEVEIADDAQEKAIFWTAFPRLLRVKFTTDRGRWDAADSSRDRQDEYCEWGVEKEDGKITRVTFTCEVPEYWEALARDDPESLLLLYQELVGPEVELEDLFDGDAYNRRNRWNSRTDAPPVHLIQGNNNRGAAVELAAAASIVRVIDGRPIVAEQELIRCSGFGEERRNSDPHIGAEINALARMKADVTLADPVGLYISDFTPAGWTTPDDTDPKSFWSYTRGEEGRRLRGVYEVSEDKDYVVGDIKIKGQPIGFGAQIADFVSVKIVGVACRFGESQGEPFTVCKR